MSFERNARRAIELVYLAQVTDERGGLSEAERWLSAVRLVLYELVPSASERLNSVHNLSFEIRNELIRLQEQEGLTRRGSLAVLEKRLESILRQYRLHDSSSRRTPSIDTSAIVKRQVDRLSPNEHERKSSKRTRFTKKRSREFMSEHDE